jgi:hypothetical protein
MGMWSVYCGASNITINTDQECCIIPIKEEYPEIMSWIPQSLPIFGKYNDYGGMYDIVEDDNTKLISEHFGITIQEFVDFLTSSKYDDEYKVTKKKIGRKGKLTDIKGWHYMWVNKEVYEFMSKDYSEHYFFSKLNDWRSLKIAEKIQRLGYPFNIDYMRWSDPEFVELMIKKNKERYGKSITQKSNPIAMKYFDDLEVFGDRLAGVSYFKEKMKSMSNNFKPYVDCITPQCGDYKEHQILLENFAEINKKYIVNYD